MWNFLVGEYLIVPSIWQTANEGKHSSFIPGNSEFTSGFINQNACSRDSHAAHNKQTIYKCSYKSPISFSNLFKSWSRNIGAAQYLAPCNLYNVKSESFLCLTKVSAFYTPIFLNLKDADDYLVHKPSGDAFFDVYRFSIIQHPHLILNN